jgi:hypothetical protein
MNITRSGENLDYKVFLATTRPRWGGLRWWFICPLLENGHTCGRRVRKLYRPRYGKYYGCRRCHNLSYVSRNDGKNEHCLGRKQAECVWEEVLPSTTLFHPNRRVCGGRRTGACGSKKNSITIVTSRKIDLSKSRRNPVSTGC